MLTPRQLEVLRFNESDDRFLLADGPIRCGKTFPTSIGFAQWVVDRPHHSHALLGYTAETAFRNVVPNLLDTWDYIGVPHRMIRGAAARLVVNEQTEVYVMGAGTILGENRLRGLELVGLYCDELATYPKDVYEMAMGRLSVPGAKAWGTCNPGPARHWVKTEIIDANMCRRVGPWQLSRECNPSLTQEFIDDVGRRYTGHTHRRLILGEWCDATGLIFPTWHEENRPAGDPASTGLSVDWASSGTFAAILVEQHADAEYIVAERVHDATETGPLTDAEQARATDAWVKAHSRSAAVSVVGDPSTSAGFQKALGELGYSWRDANNAVLPGIAATREALGGKRLRVTPVCHAWAAEASGYVWDAKAAQRGEDRPVKARDHLMDATRYWAASATPAFAYRVV